MTSLAAAAREDDALPRRFGRYILFDKIGEGGMARIYLAREKSSLGGNRLLVVKEILPLLAASPEMSRLLVDEAKLCAELVHRNIVQVDDLGREQDRLYIAMEYVEGLDLRELLRGCSQKKIPLPVQFSLFVVTETLRALDYAHRKKNEEGRLLGIVHRDVSPSNILLSVEGEVKLCDFGIARVLTTGDVVPEEAIQGKAGYMSPEAARGDGVDARSDVFAAGIVLWELLSGQRLYRSGGGRGTPLEQARAAAVPALTARGYPDEERLHRIVRTALSQEAEHRYQSAQAMLADLDTYVLDNQLVQSALKFGDWLVENFSSEIVENRRERERAAKELDDVSGQREAIPVAPSSPRSELPTVPDTEIGRTLPPEAFPDSSTETPLVNVPTVHIRESGKPPAPRKFPVAFLVLLVAVLSAVIAFFFGKR